MKLTHSCNPRYSEVPITDDASDAVDAADVDDADSLTVNSSLTDLKVNQAETGQLGQVSNIPVTTQLESTALPSP